MKIEDYPEFVKQLCKPGKDIREPLTPEKCELLHMAVGIAGEAGELLDAIKKHVIYNQQLDINNVIEELGDLEFYMQGVRNILFIGRTQILLSNMYKLKQRYESMSYTDEDAQARKDKQQ